MCEHLNMSELMNLLEESERLQNLPPFFPFINLCRQVMKTSGKIFLVENKYLFGGVFFYQAEPRMKNLELLQAHIKALTANHSVSETSHEPRLLLHP